MSARLASQGIHRMRQVVVHCLASSEDSRRGCECQMVFIGVTRTVLSWLGEGHCLESPLPCRQTKRREGAKRWWTFPFYLIRIVGNLKG